VSNAVFGLWAANTPWVASATFSSTGIDTWRNGASIDSTPASTPGAATAVLRLGAGGTTTPAEYWLGSIGAVLIYSGAHNTATRRSIEAWLGSEWGITVV
jgi:hypothetical protein